MYKMTPNRFFENIDYHFGIIRVDPILIVCKLI